MHIHLTINCFLLSVFVSNSNSLLFVNLLFINDQQNICMNGLNNNFTILHLFLESTIISQPLWRDNVHENVYFQQIRYLITELTI